VQHWNLNNASSEMQMVDIGKGVVAWAKWANFVMTT
jgi:hypothetical protein